MTFLKSIKAIVVERLLLELCCISEFRFTTPTLICTSLLEENRWNVYIMSDFLHWTKKNCFFSSTKTDTISMEKLIDFMNEKQRDPRLNEISFPLYSENRCMEIINKYEKSEENRKNSNFLKIISCHMFSYIYYDVWIFQNVWVRKVLLNTCYQMKMLLYSLIDWTSIKIWISQCVTIMSILVTTLIWQVSAYIFNNSQLFYLNLLLQEGNLVANLVWKSTGRFCYLVVGVLSWIVGMAKVMMKER